MNTQAQEAMQAQFADWLEAAGSQPGCEEVTWQAWQAGWAAALQWAAQLAEQREATAWSAPLDANECYRMEFADLLRPGGETA